MALMKLCRCGKKIGYNIKHCNNCSIEIENEKREKVKRYDRDTRNSNSNKRYTTFYNSKAWRVLSEVVKGKYNGLCVMCLVEDEEATESDTTHHIVELKEEWNLRLIEENLIPLCHECHNNLHINYTEKEKENLRKLILKFNDKYK